ncbi:UDP-glucuronic acid decarboxylase family protein [Aquibium sp. ELW1220]|uniref:UDP-glucuronic acid decarboxylase family protein n=1 Tax=Aquibium sp. ELW1220 TaxID=2976766 RepID=UPI0025B1EA17|nr:UDP-glucuronic acid decarboxylase family protein [Aquibium sp. ELW1220]MDN2579118.1 SDR family oxidoreductase [Aquibium sp. ELW1220]
MQHDNGVRWNGISLVAGGAGFLGSHLVERLLSERRRVVCVDSFLSGTGDNIARFASHPGFRLVRQDIQRPLPLDGEAIDEIYNLACAASPPRYQADPHHTMMTSVIGTSNLLELASARGARFLQASTSEIYGDPEVHPQTEDYVGSVNCTGPRACYDEGKRAAETICFDFLRVGRADARIARIFNTYGPRMRADDGRIVSNFIVQALAGERMTVFGDGSQTRSFCYVSDLIDGLVRLMRVDPNPGCPVNLGNPGEFTVEELAAIVSRKIPTAQGIRRMPLPQDDPRRRQPDIARARTLLGWEPKVALDEGLAQTIAWFSQQRAGRKLEAAE